MRTAWAVWRIVALPSSVDQWRARSGNQPARPPHRKFHDGQPGVLDVGSQLVRMVEQGGREPVRPVLGAATPAMRTNRFTARGC